VAGVERKEGIGNEGTGKEVRQQDTTQHVTT
jgi:hypothetical protein